MRTQFDKKRFFRNLPENASEPDKVYFKNLQTYECPALNVYHFDSINFLPDSTLFKGIVPLELSFLFFRKRIKHHNMKGILSIRLNWKKKRLAGDNAFLIIHDGWTQNYYHWITQALPRLLLAQQTQQPFILLLPDDHLSEFHTSSLKLLKVTSWQTLTRSKQYYAVKNLLYPTHDIQVGDYNDDLIRVLREKLRQAPKLKATRKLFIRRLSQDKRRIVNETEVIETFLSYAFEIVEFERLSFAEQLSLMSSTIILAGVHGAGLTNMIFMPDQSIVFELTTRVDGENYYFYSLSNSMSHKYYYQSCAVEKEEVIQKANLIVDIEKLKENLTLILSR